MNHTPDFFRNSTHFMLILCAFALSPSAFASDTYFAWSGAKGTQCAEYKAKHGSWIRNASSDNCDTKALVYYQWEEDPRAVQARAALGAPLDPAATTTDSAVPSFSSKCVAYSACGGWLGVQDASRCAGVPNHFVEHAWPAIIQNPRPWAIVEANSGRSIPFDADHHFLPQAAPDVVYAWKTAALLSTQANASNPNSPFPMPKTATLYTWRTPIGSFGYSSHPMRVKLRSTIPFYWVHLDGADKPQESTTGFDGRKFIFVKGYSMTNFNDDERFPGQSRSGIYSDFSMRTDAPFESWSVESAYGYEEMQQEYNFVSTHLATPTQEFDSLANVYVDNGSRTLGVPGAAPWNYPLHFDSVSHTTSSADDVNWSIDSLQRRMSYTATTAQAHFDNGDQVVYFAKDVVPSLWNHFSTRLPSYFNYLDSNQVPQDTWPERDSSPHPTCKL